jgi:hypothetical protein
MHSSGEGNLLLETIRGATWTSSASPASREKAALPAYLLFLSLRSKPPPNFAESSTIQRP